MTQMDILEELKRFPITGRLSILEAAMRLIREDLQEETELQPQEEKGRRLAEAAEALRGDYAADSELTAFTAFFESLFTK